VRILVALLPSPTGANLVAQLRCYARAVAGPGWDSLETTRRTSSISSEADARVVALIDPTALRVAEEQIGTTSFGANPPCEQSGATRR
jgi:hypothetical protein